MIINLMPHTINIFNKNKDENFANLSDDEVCLGIICEDCADKLEYEEDYGGEEDDFLLLLV